MNFKYLLHSLSTEFIDDDFFFFWLPFHFFLWSLNWWFNAKAQEKIKNWGINLNGIFLCISWDLVFLTIKFCVNGRRSYHKTHTGGIFRILPGKLETSDKRRSFDQDILVDFRESLTDSEDWQFEEFQQVANNF